MYDKYIGRIYESNNFGPFTLIKYLGKDDKGYKHYNIKFINTGTISEASIEAIRKGRVKDKYAPNVAGIGYIGSFEGKITSEEIMMLYRPWNDMIHRCYNQTDKDYCMYGALGIRVDPRWFDFGNYYHDVQELPGFENKLKYPDKYQLDKDYLQMHIPKSQRIYSRDTCMWISKHDNIVLMNRESINSSGYYGVVYRNHGYRVRFGNIAYGNYSDPIAAANAYNHAYLLSSINNKFNNIIVINDVPYMSPKETTKYLLNPKTMCKIIHKE